MHGLPRERARWNGLRLLGRAAIVVPHWALHRLHDAERHLRAGTAHAGALHRPRERARCCAIDEARFDPLVRTPLRVDAEAKNGQVDRGLPRRGVEVEAPRAADEIDWLSSA